MSKTSKILIAVMVLAVLLLGIGYAAIQNVTLNITGTAMANPNQANFKVQFSGEPTVSDVSKVTAGVTDELNATMNVVGLTAKGDEVTATYTVQNASEDLSADLAVETTNSNTEYFTIKSELEETSLTAGEATTVVVTVRLTKTLIESEEERATIGIKLTAMPVEPGMEGTSSGINGSSQSPEASSATLADLVTNDNIGDYIDLGNDIVDYNGTTGVTTDDWRVLYVDEETDTVYAILSDYLPVSQIPEGTGLQLGREGMYSVSVINEQSNVLINALKNETIWSTFANEIEGALVIGSPTLELLLRSYNTKNGTNLDCESGYAELDSSTEDINLYVSHSDEISMCMGYKLATNGIMPEDVMGVNYGYGIGSGSSSDPYSGIRPVVALPLSVSALMLDGVLTVAQ